MEQVLRSPVNGVTTNAETQKPRQQAEAAERYRALQSVR